MFCRKSLQKIFTWLLTFVLIGCHFTLYSGQNEEKTPKTVYKIVLNEEIMPGAWRLIQTAVEEAEARKVDYILLKINTYGGRLDIADSIRTKMLKAKPICIAFIDNNAASAGALISIACDSIYMVTGANIGAATVVNENAEALPDKYQSYMRGMMRSTAEAQGRDPNIAEAMVDQSLKVAGVSDSGKVLTFTTSEAITHNFCEAQVETIAEVLDELGLKDAIIIEHKLTTIDKMIHFFLNPVVNGLLMMLIIGGIYFELQSPGIGFPLAAAIFGAVFFFVPHYMEGLAEHWEILLFFIGLLLLGLEIFVIPGFGIAGVAGILCVFTALTLSLLQNHNFDFTFTGFDDIAFAMFRILISFILSIGILILFGKNILKSSLFQTLVLQDTQEVSEGFSVNVYETSSLVDKNGVAVTPLHPSGKVEIGNERYDATTEGEYIESGESITIIKAVGNKVTVRKA